MKKYIIPLSFVILFLFSSFNTNYVYICTGKYSKKYHLVKKCRGLSNCKSEIKKVTLIEAKKKKTLCGWED